MEGWDGFVDFRFMFRINGTAGKGSFLWAESNASLVFSEKLICLNKFRQV